MRYMQLLVLLLLLLGCSTHRLRRDAEEASDRGQWDQAARLWTSLLEQNPGQTRAQINLERAKLKAGLNHLGKAQDYARNNQLEEALFEARIALGYDPHNQMASDLLDALEEKQKQHSAREQKAEPSVEEEPASRFPTLEPSHWDTVDLLIPRPQDVRQIYTTLGRNYGINILVDGEIKSEKLAVELRDMDFLKALDTLLLLNRHFFKVVDSKTLIIFKDNKSNRERFDNRVVKTYYLSNVAPKELEKHLRSLGEMKEMGVNEELNAISLRGTPEQIALADRLIAANDKPSPEVVIEVELLEVNKSAMREVGLLPVAAIQGQSPYAIGVTADPADRSDNDEDVGGLRGLFPRLRNEDLLTILPAVAINFLKETGDSKQVANPHLRVTAGQEAFILIGQQVPTASTSFTPIGPGSGGTLSQLGGQPLTTFNYQDVGINLKITPRVHHNDEVTMKMDLEVSSILTAGLQPTFGKRKVSTTIRLKNGETNVLAGLLTNDERRSLTGIAGLSDIPLLGKLFSNDDRTIRQTDIVLTLKPVIVRGPNLSEADRAPYELTGSSMESLFRPSRAKTAEGQKKRVLHLGREEGQQGEEPQRAPFSSAPLQRPSDPSAAEPDAPPAAASNESSEEAPREEAPQGGTLASDEAAEPSPIMLAFSPALLTARKDQILEAQVFLANAQNLQLAEIGIAFPNQLLAVEAIEAGDLALPAQERPLITPAWNHENGRISLIITGRTDMPVMGSGILANLRFRVLASGVGELSFDLLKMRGPAGEELPSQGLATPLELAP